MALITFQKFNETQEKQRAKNKNASRFTIIELNFQHNIDDLYIWWLINKFVLLVYQQHSHENGIFFCSLSDFLFFIYNDISFINVERYSLRQYSTWTNNWHISIEFWWGDRCDGVTADFESTPSVHTWQQVWMKQHYGLFLRIHMDSSLSLSAHTFHFFYYCIWCFGLVHVVCRSRLNIWNGMEWNGINLRNVGNFSSYPNFVLNLLLLCANINIIVFLCSEINSLFQIIQWKSLFSVQLGWYASHVDYT